MHLADFCTVTDVMAADVTCRLIALDAESADPSDVLVSSPGGHLESGDAIHDIERNRWLSAEEVVEYGLVSRTIERKTELRGA
jgi:ATP-dependent protease ClpP protease subunit